MPYLIAGLVIFLGMHSLHIYADAWRTRMRAQVGDMPFKAIYSLVSLAGLLLIIWGFGLARETPVMVWNPPVAMRHIAGLLTLIAFVFLASAYSLPNAIKSRVHHPMVLAVKTWAFAHLLANGTLAHMVLFGSFLVWAVLDFIASRKRDRAQGTRYATATTRGTVIAVVTGALAWAVFAFWLHGLLIGVKPLGV